MIPGSADRGLVTCPMCLFPVEFEVLAQHRRTCDIVAAYLQWELVAFLEDPMAYGKGVSGS
jgi:hypothetical protein